MNWTKCTWCRKTWSSCCRKHPGTPRSTSVPTRLNDRAYGNLGAPSPSAPGAAGVTATSVFAGSPRGAVTLTPDIGLAVTENRFLNWDRHIARCAAGFARDAVVSSLREAVDLGGTLVGTVPFHAAEDHGHEHGGSPGARQEILQSGISDEIAVLGCITAWELLVQVLLALYTITSDRPNS